MRSPCRFFFCHYSQNMGIKLSLQVPMIQPLCICWKFLQEPRRLSGFPVQNCTTFHNLGKKHQQEADLLPCILSDCLTCTWDGLQTTLMMHWYTVSRRSWGGSLIWSRESLVKFFSGNISKTVFANGEQLSMNDFWISTVARTFLWKWIINSRCTLEHQEAFRAILCVPVAGKCAIELKEEVVGHWMGYLGIFSKWIYTLRLFFFPEALREDILCLRLSAQWTPSCASADTCLCSLYSLPADRIFWSECTFLLVKQHPNEDLGVVLSLRPLPTGCLNETSQSQGQSSPSSILPSNTSSSPS